MTVVIAMLVLATATYVFRDVGTCAGDEDAALEARVVGEHLVTCRVG